MPLGLEVASRVLVNSVIVDVITDCIYNDVLTHDLMVRDVFVYAFRDYPSGICFPTLAYTCILGIRTAGQGYASLQNGGHRSVFTGLKTCKSMSSVWAQTRKASPRSCAA